MNNGNQSNNLKLEFSNKTSSDAVHQKNKNGIEFEFPIMKNKNLKQKQQFIMPPPSKSIISILAIIQLMLATVQLIDNSIVILLKKNSFQHSESR